MQKNAKKVQPAKQYRTEASRVRDLLDLLHCGHSPWGPLKTATEFDFQSGRTDVIALSETGVVLAFEAKLKRWKEALHQAYRNTCFSTVSYVVLPESVALRAQSFIEDFDLRGVGICCVTRGELVVLHAPRSTTPVLPWLTERAIETAMKSRSGWKTGQPNS